MRLATSTTERQSSHHGDSARPRRRLRSRQRIRRVGGIDLCSLTQGQMRDACLSPNRWVPRILLIVQLVIAALIFRNWAYVTTYRLYLDHRTGGVQSSAVQQFDVEAQHVVPRIVTRDADRIEFMSQLNQDSVVRVEVRSPARATYSILWRHAGTERTLASGVVEGSAVIASPFPSGNGTIELASNAPVTWVDPRIVRDLKINGHLILLALLLLVSLVWHHRQRNPEAI